MSNRDMRAHYNNDGMDPDWRPPEQPSVSKSEYDSLHIALAKCRAELEADREWIARYAGGVPGSGRRVTRIDAALLEMGSSVTAGPSSS